MNGCAPSCVSLVAGKKERKKKPTIQVLVRSLAETHLFLYPSPPVSAFHTTRLSIHAIFTKLNCLSQEANSENKGKIIVIIIYPLTPRVTGSPKMNLQTRFLHVPLFSTALWDLPNSGPVHSLTLSSHLFLCLVFFPLSLCLARRFWPDLVNGRHDHTTAVCVCKDPDPLSDSVRWSDLLLRELIYDTRFHWFAPLVSRGSWSDRRTESDTVPGS